MDLFFTQNTSPNLNFTVLKLFFLKMLVWNDITKIIIALGNQHVNDMQNFNEPNIMEHFTNGQTKKISKYDIFICTINFGNNLDNNIQYIHWHALFYKWNVQNMIKYKEKTKQLFINRQKHLQIDENRKGIV